jgi:hypothetical protein
MGPYLDENMKPQFKKQGHVFGRALLAGLVALAFVSVPLKAGDAKGAVPASILSKLDEHLALVAKKSRGEPPFDKPTTLQPDVYQSNGRVLVEIQGTVSKELADQITSLGGQLVAGWGTATIFRAWIPFAQVETVAARADIRSISAARPSITHRIVPTKQS